MKESPSSSFAIFGTCAAPIPRAPEPPKKKKKNSPFACSGSTLCKKLSSNDDDPSKNVEAASTGDIFTAVLNLSADDVLTWPLRPRTDDAQAATINTAIRLTIPSACLKHFRFAVSVKRIVIQYNT